MKGSIYSDQRCSICSGRLVHDENRDGLFCPTHLEVRATGRFRVKYGRHIMVRFKKYDTAADFLLGLRFKDKEGTFDPRDYRGDNPLGFETLARAWLKTKAHCSKTHRNNLKRYMETAIAAWGQANVKTLGYGDVEDLVLPLKVGGKTKHDMVTSAYRPFFKWVQRREGVPAPELPTFAYTMGYREIIPLGVQQEIIDEVQRITERRMWLAIKWLGTYIAIRPGEMRQLRERDVNSDGFLVLRPERTKERTIKKVPMLAEDIALAEALPEPLDPDLPFFRWEQAHQGYPAGRQVGIGGLYKIWKRACKNLGIEGVDLYGGTKHSTTTALSGLVSEEQLQKYGTMHKTNVAFQRYVRGEAKPSTDIYALRETVVNPAKKAEVIPLRKGDTLVTGGS